MLNVLKRLLLIPVGLVRSLRYPRVRRALLLVVGLFVVANVIMYMMYNDRTYPNTMLAGQRIGSVGRDNLDKKLTALRLVPDEVAFTQGNGKQSTKLKADSLQVKLNMQRQIEQLMSSRSWLPLANLVFKHESLIAVDHDDTTKDTLEAALAVFQRSPNDARIIKNGDSFAIAPDEPGQSLDAAASEQHLRTALEHGQDTVTVATKSQAASVTTASLQPKLKELQQRSRLKINLRYTGKVKDFSSADIVGWYVEENGSVSLSAAAIQTTIIATGRDWGIRVGNLQAATNAIATGLNNSQPVNFTLEAAPAGKKLSYCTAVRGVASSELAVLDSKLTETFTDSRGWGLDGLVEYSKVSSGCDFTVWLTAADQMASFGEICDSLWSCMVSPNVVINYDRWRNASDAWNAQGGDLQDYRAMVINHETGHWLGFYHSSCPGAGQQAPVMQQQSIDLQGCTFNPWPTAGERNSLKQRLGL